VLSTSIRTGKSCAVRRRRETPEPCRVRLALDEDDDIVALQDLLYGGHQPLEDGASEVTLEVGRYGYRWLRLLRRGQCHMP